MSVFVTAAAIIAALWSRPAFPITSANVAMPQETRLSESARTASALPFTAADLAAYFAKAIKQTPRRTGDRSFLFEPARDRRGSKIVIVSDGVDVLLRFWVQDEYEMNTAARFCRAAMFEPDESELLWELLFAGPGMHWAGGNRFDVLCDFQIEPEQTVVSFFFSPPRRIARIRTER